MTRKVWVSAIVIALIASLIPIIIEIVPTVISADTWYVDDVPGGNPPEDFTSIQAAVDFAQPGDTVFVYAGTYYEDVTITKTINFLGEDRDTTIINATNTAILAENADYINISGFTLLNGSSAGIRLRNSNNSLIENNRVEKNNYGIKIIESNNTIIRKNIASNSSGNYHGIYLSKSTNITIKTNICSNNKFGSGIWLQESPNNYIVDNILTDNHDGVFTTIGSDFLRFHNNTIETNTEYGVWIDDSENNLFTSNFIKNNNKGIYFSWYSVNNELINSTIINSSTYDIGVRWGSHVDALNTTFNKSKTYFDTIDSTITTQWYLHINVTDLLGNPISNANVKIEDNKNGSYNDTYITNGNGHLGYVTLTEYIEKDTFGDTIGEKKYYTPHRIVAWNNTLVGYAYPEPIINESKTVTIVLYNGTLLDLESGWNLISLPRIQSNTDLEIVLQPIGGRYDSVQWYNISDNNDHWKHYHVLKPSYMNDLEKINHTMGFWLHVTDPEGTTLVIFGDVLITEQHIAFHPGWNLVGFPSNSNKTRDVALDNLFYGSDVDSIWTYNATTQKWVELNDALDYFEIGQGYWFHAKTECVWNVPL